MFKTIYTYKVATLPVPALFISAFSKVPRSLISQTEQSVLVDIVELIEKAQEKYKAKLIMNEPTKDTHNMDFSSIKNAVAVYCSLRFESLLDMKDFLTEAGVISE